MCAAWREPFSRALSSRAPWLASGLCCPAGSLLTTASCAPLGSSLRLIFFVSKSLFRPITTGTAAERFPNLLCVSVLSCRLPYPGGPHGCSRLILRHARWPSPTWYRLGIHG